jgi:hypothetical protein
MGQVPNQLTRSGEIEATILVKALPQVSENHGETVCVAAMDDQRRWFRFYPVAFRQLEDTQKFKRWHRVKLRGRLPEIRKDNRSESRNVDQDSIKLLGKMPSDRRSAFIEPAIVASTKKERSEGRSLALIRPSDAQFFHRPRSLDEIAKRRSLYSRLLAAPDMFAAKSIIPLTPAPYEFGYRYRDDDGPHECLCHDWEVEQTFLNWRRDHDEKKTLDMVQDTFGRRYPEDGFVLAMGTHSRYPDVWMIIGVIRMAPVTQPTFL